MNVNNKYYLIKYVFFISLLSFLLNNETAAFMKAPNPFVYKSNFELWDINPNHLIMDDWLVFSDRENNSVYKKADDKSGIVKKAHFLEKFKVIDKQGRYIKLSEVNTKKFAGWGKIENFLLLNNAIKTNDLITHKALIINRLSKIKGNINYINPLKAPYVNASPTNRKIKLLDVAYIFHYFPNQKKPAFVLIGLNSYFFGKQYLNNRLSIDEVILGWVPANRIFVWNTREALQPNNLRKHPIYYFKNLKDIKSYYSLPQENNEIPDCRNIPLCSNNDKTKNTNDFLVVMPDTNNKINRTKWPSELFRYPLLEKNNDNRKPFHIGIPYASLNSERIRQYLEIALENSSNRDVVFVIDATYSMEPYIKLVGKIINNVMDKFIIAKKLNKETGELRFGINVYRDYHAGNKVFEKIIELTSNNNNIYNSTQSIKIIDGEKFESYDTYYQEAVFQGLCRSIEETNWSKYSRKMIIHIGDMGNHGKKDNYKIEDIVSLLVERDISYHAIQIVNNDKNKQIHDAQSLFCKQTLSIIIQVIDKWIEKINKSIKDDKLLPDKTMFKLLHELIRVKMKSINPEYCDIKTCCESLNSKRWTLQCLNANDLINYKKLILSKIESIAQEVIDTRSLITDLIIGNIKIDEFSKDVSYKPQLMPGIMDKLIINVGNRIYNSKKLSGLDKYPTIQNEIKKLNDKTISFHQQKNIEKRIIKILGANEIKRYLQNNAQFFTDAYVMFKRPGSKYINDPPQLKKMVLFDRREFESLLLPLQMFTYKYQCIITPSNIKDIWKSFLSGILGQHNTNLNIINHKITINDAFKRQHGITLRSDHPLLKISYSEIVAGLYKFDKKDLNDLANYLCNKSTKLKQIYENESNYFSIFGTKYIWVDSSELP